MPALRKCVTHTDGATPFIQCTCGCPSVSPVNVPVAVLQEAATSATDLVRVADDLPGRPRHAASAVRYAAIHAYREGLIDAIPEGWPTR